VGKGYATGEIEVKDRRSGERSALPFEGAAEELVRLADSAV
jgi:hypothetical protein